ncbi:MAG: transcription antitermination protein [Halapricum sp.]
MPTPRPNSNASDRGLIALTDADLSEAAIRERFAGLLASVASVYERWAGDAFTQAATTTRELAASIASGDIEPTKDHPLIAALEGIGGEAERVGAGLIGVGLVLDGWALQCVSFFVNEADEAAADEFREVRSALESIRAAGEKAVESEQRAAAVAAALDIVTVTYEDYVETLDGLGLDPKTVC